MLAITIVLTIFWLLRGLAVNGANGILATLGEMISGYTISLAVMVKLRG